MEPPVRDVRRFAAEPHFDPDAPPTELDGEPPTSFAAHAAGQFPASLLESVELPAGDSQQQLQALRAQHRDLLAGRPQPELLEGASLVAAPPSPGEFATPVAGDTRLRPPAMQAEPAHDPARRRDDD
ncbi:MAG: hypothetical protein QGG57_04385 [Candidatus Poseidoniia archaeon]|nr:hypothetical protein [Candidatus Poseidoniia archaeon]